jgi:hypothetical protein
VKEQLLDSWGYPDCIIREDGSILLPNGRIITEAYNSGQVSLPTAHGNGFAQLSRLVAEAFVPNPHHHQYIVYLDGNRHNSNANNLEWTERKFRNTGVIKEGMRGEIIRLYVGGIPIVKISKELKISRKYVEVVVEDFERTVATAP